MQNAARICSQNALVSTTLSKRSILSCLNISSVLLLMLLNFPLLGVKFPNWEENFFPTTPWSLTQKARQSSLAFRQFWKFSDCTHNEISNNPSLGPGSALGEKGEKIGVAKEIISERSEPERESGEGKGWPFPLPNCTAGLASLADIFPVWPRFLPFFPPPLQTLVQGYNNPRWWDRELKEEEKPWIALNGLNGFVVTWRAWKLSRCK